MIKFCRNCSMKFGSRLTTHVLNAKIGNFNNLVVVCKCHTVNCVAVGTASNSYSDTVNRMAPVNTIFWTKNQEDTAIK